MLPAAGGPSLGKEEDMPHTTVRVGDSVKNGKIKVTFVAKDRSKSRPNPKAKYKKRKKR